ncbi:MAG TPA: hypothetical protein VND64_35280 [Pirellulales bacterium]|nr:hypothetical protein [Pirellulales bacterium]
MVRCQLQRIAKLGRRTKGDIDLQHVPSVTSTDALKAAGPIAGGP